MNCAHHHLPDDLCLPSAPRRHVSGVREDDDAEKDGAGGDQGAEREQELELGLGQHALQVLEGGDGDEEGEHARRSHVLAGAYRLEADERDLHGEEEAEDVEGRVAGEEAVGEAPHDEQGKHVQRDQVDDEDVAAPGGHL